VQARYALTQANLNLGIRMAGFKYLDQNERRTASVDARKAILEKMKSRVIPGHPEFEKVQAERVRAAIERDERQRTAKEDKIRREAEEKTAKEAAYQAQIKAERAAYQAKMAEQKERENEQKSARDARYAARKARTGKKA
jgi:Family of unknown function (DUF6481)